MPNKWNTPPLAHRTPLATGLLFALATLLGQAPVLAQSTSTTPDWALLDTYCSECHNLDDFAGGLAFELLGPERFHEDTATWEQVIRKLKAGMMPPQGNPRPESEVLHAFVQGLEQRIDTQALAQPNPGAPLLRRLNRTEYGNAVRDLLDLPVDTRVLMPADDSSGGFDNVANVLSISPALLEAYVSAAAKIARLALGDPDTVPSTTVYRGDGQSQARHQDGLPLGTRGGIGATHVFPLDAEYEISVARSGANSAFSLTPFGFTDPVEIVVDGARVALLQPDDRGLVRLALPAGSHQIQAAYLQTSPGLGVDDLHEVWANSTSIGSLSIRGPLNASGPGHTASRERIFICQPESPSQEADCARDIIRALATRAFRRPVDSDSLERLLAFYQDGRERGSFDTGIQYALTRILVDPQFIFRFEGEREDLAPGEIYAIDDYELATRLSFFLWSSIPDQQLLDLAGTGRLSQPEVLSAAVQRMLADPKAEALVDNFATQWLTLRRLDVANPVSEAFDNSLRRAMAQETLHLFRHILREDRSVIELLNADYTFVNERLARHYGIPHVRGSHFRQVPVADEARRGLLGHASILTITSAPNRTSPVMRGTWVLEHLLGTPPPPPPPGVETNLEESVGTSAAALTIREQLERHRADPSCAACHNMIDPVGFALENFDAIGKWRDSIAGQPVNTASKLWDGSPLDGPNSLRNALLERQDLFIETFIENLMTYALGRTVEYTDMPSVRAIAKQARAQDYRLGAIVQGIVEAPAFRMRVNGAESDLTLGQR